MVNSNPGFLSTLSVTPNTRIVDGTDNIHSGIINSLNIATGGNCVLSGFNITQQDGGDYTRYVIASGKILRNGLLVSISGATITPSAGSRDGNDWYATVVVKADNTLAIRDGAKDNSTASVSTLTADDIPVAIIKYVDGSADDAVNRLVQFLGYDGSTKGISILNSGTETLRINADGTLTKGGSGTITLPASGTLATEDQIQYTSAIAQGNAGLIPGSGVGTSNIADDAVTYAKMQNVSATDRILGRDSSGAGIIEEITPANLRTMLGIETGATADQTNAEIETAYNAQVAQVSEGERNAGTEAAVKRFSPADIKSMIDTHETDTNTDVDVSVANLKTRLNSNFGDNFQIGTNGAHTATFAGGLIVGGNLTVNGTTTTISSNTLSVGDNIIVLNNDVTGTPSQNAGMEIERGSSTNVGIRWNETTDRWEFSNDGATYYNIPITSELANPYTHPGYATTNIDTSGAEIVDSITTNDTGHITAMAKRTLTLADLGYTGATDANKYVHPNHSGDVTSNADGATTIADNAVVTAKIADDAITSAKINDGEITNAHINGSAAIAQSKISGLTSALSGKEPSLTISEGLNRNSATLKVDIDSLTTENGLDRTADFIMYDDATNGLRKINAANLFSKLVAADIPDVSATYRATATTLVNADISNTAAISADKIADGTTNKLFTATLKTKLDGIAASATVGADWSSNVSNISVTNAQLAGSIANTKLANSSVTINGTSLALGGTLTLQSGDVDEGGSNKYYTDERVDDRVNALITDGEGITTTYDDSAGTLTVEAEVATSSNKGVASFSSDDFIITSGHISRKNGSVSDAQLAGNIAQSKITNLVSNLASKVETLSDLSITASATELNVLDGIPAGLTTTELGYLDGVTSAIQTQLNTKLETVAMADLTDVSGIATDISGGVNSTAIPTAQAVKDFVGGLDEIDYDLAVVQSGNNVKLNLTSSQGVANTILLEPGLRTSLTVPASGRLIIGDGGKGSVDSAAFSQGTLTLTHSDGTTTTATIPDSTTDAHGLMTDDQFDKLAGIEVGADATDKANVVASLGLLDETDTLYLGDAGNDTTVRIRGNLFVDGTTTTINQTEINVQDALIFEGATGDDYETTLRIIDPTADRVISLPDITGTIVTTGDSQTVATGMIANLGVTTGKINSNAVTSGKLATDAVVTAKIQDDAVTTAKIVDDAVTIAKIDGITNAGSGSIITSAERTKLSGIATGAEVNVQSDWNASSGDAKILNKPNVQYTSAIPDATASQTGLATSTQITKLDAIEASADVTDATNVNAAGAFMHTDIPDTDTGFIKRTGSETYDIDTSTYLTSLSVTGLSDVAAFETNFADGVSANDDSLASAKAIKAYVDSVGGAATGSTTFTIEDDDDDTILIAHGKHIKFDSGAGISTDWTDTDNGTNADPYTMTIANTGVTSNVAGTGISVSGATGAVTVTNTDLGSSQNIFKNIKVSGQDTIVADTNDDDLTFAAGSNVTLTTNATNDTLTITSSYVNDDVSIANLKTRLNSDLGGDFTIGTQSDDTATFSGGLVIGGNLTVNGTTTTLDTQNLAVEDKNIILGTGNATTTVLDGSGITLEGNSGDDITFQYNLGNTQMELKHGSAFENFKAGTITGTFVGGLTGNVTGNADTATTLATARNIAGKSFDGSANITIATTDLSDITALDTDLSSVSASDDTLATAKAIKTYVDAQVDTVDTFSELTDVTFTSPSVGHIPIYDATQSRWENAQITAGTNVSITNADASITITSTDTTYTAAANKGLVVTNSTQFGLDDPDNTNIQLMSSSANGSASNPAQRNAATGDEILVWDIDNSEWTFMSLSHLADFSVENSSGGGIKTFKTISVSNDGGSSSGSDMVADATADTLDIEAQAGITLTAAGGSSGDQKLSIGVGSASITNAMLANDSVSFGGVSLDLGQSDATPAFDLTDATNYPTSSLSGTITNAQLAGSIANAKLANSTITVSDGSNSTATALGGTITFAGTANEVEVAESSGTITVGLPSNVTLGGDLNVNGGDIVVGTGNNAAGIFTAGTGQLLLGNDYDEDDGNEGMIGIRGDGGVSKVVGISNTLELMTDRNTDDIKFTTGTNSTNDGNTTNHVKIDGGTRTTHFYGANYDATIVDGKITLGAIGNVSGESSSILSVNSLGAVKINLDTNSNDTGSYFRVTEGGSGDIFNVDYEGNTTVYGDLTVTGNDIKSSSGDTVMTLSNDDVTFASKVTIGDSYMQDDGSNWQHYANEQFQHFALGQWGGHFFYTKDGVNGGSNVFQFGVDYTGNLRLGNVDNKLIYMQDTAHDVAGKNLTIQAGNTTAGTTNNIAGGHLYLDAGRGKGTGAGGNIYFRVANAGSSGSSINSQTTAMTISDDATISTASTLTVGGDLIVSGSTTTVNSNTVNIGDSIITLNSDETGTPSQDAGIEIERGTSSNVAFYWDESAGKWQVGSSKTLVASTFEGNLTGNADTATALATARDIHGVSFDGSANIDLTEVIQDTVGAMFSGNTETNITATYQDSDGTIDLVTSSVGDGLSYSGSTANGLLTYGGASTIDVESTLTYDSSGMIKITSTGYGRIEMQGNSGAYIDMKNDDADDYDARLLTDGTGLDIITAGGSSPISLKTNGTQRMKIEDAQTTLAHHLSFGTTSNPYIKAGTGGPLAIRGDEDGLATSYSSNTPTYSTAASIQLRVNASNQTAMEIQNNKDIKTYGFLKSGTHGDVYGANTFIMGVTGSTADNDWFEVFRWTPKTDGGSDDENWRYDNFQATFQVTARGIGRSNFKLHVRGEYGVQDSNGWWTREFIIDGWDDNVADDDTTFKMVYNAGTGGSTPYASLYQKRDEDWEYRQIKLIQCFTNCYFDYLNTNVGETDPTHDTNTGSADLDPSIRRKLYVDANEQLINGLAATGIYFDDANDRLGVGMSTPQHNLDIWGDDASIRLVDTSDTSGSAKIVVGEDSNITVASETSVEYGWEMHYNSSGNDFFELKMMDATNGDVPNALVVDRLGRVGIGTDSPSKNLDVAGDIGLTGDLYLAQTKKIYFDSTDTYIGADADTVEDLHLGADGNISLDPDGDVIVRVGSGTEYVRFDGSEQRVGIGTSSPAHKLEVNGSFAATTKSFDIEHPTEEGKRLHHGSLEGPEHGVYIRGRLEGDTIELPDYWLGLVDEDTITVQLTPNKGFQQIYVDHIEDNKVYVGTQTDTPIDCFYFIQAERKDVEKMVVEY